MSVKKGPTIHVPVTSGVLNNFQNSSMADALSSHFKDSTKPDMCHYFLKKYLIFCFTYIGQIKHLQKYMQESEDRHTVQKTEHVY